MNKPEWNVTITGNQIELRKQFGDARLLIIVSDGGWTYNKENPKSGCIYRNTKEFDIRLSMNGVCWLTNDDWNDINKTVLHWEDWLISKKENING